MGYSYGHGFGHTWKRKKRAGAVAPPAVGGGALLAGEANGFATDFTYATDAQRVAVKTAGTVVASTVDGFFTNAGTSPKMVYDSAGVLGWSPHNLATQSQTLDAWNANSNVTVVVNQAVAPDGTMTMDKVYPASSGSNRWVANTSVASPVTLTYSVYAKAAGKRWIYFLKFDGSNFGAWFDLQSGVVGNVDAAYTSSIQDMGGGIYRCIFTGPGEITPNNAIGISDANGSGSVTVSGTDGVYLWGTQFNRGTVPTAYLPTTTAARYGLALDYDPVTHASRGLLCEPAATNLHTWSQDISVLSWDGGTPTFDNQAGPDAALTADTYTENTALGTHSGYGGITTVANADYTHSRYMKMGTRRYAHLSLSDGTNGIYAVYDLQSGVVGSSGVRGTGVLSSAASMQACPNGWYRCILSGKNPSTTTYYLVSTANAASYTPVDGFGRQSFTGTSATLFVGHAQIEAGTVATSPIPTTSGTVTRAADAVKVTPASINYSATAGSWWIDLTLNTTDSGGQVIGYTTSGNTPCYPQAATTFAIYDSVAFVPKTVPSVLGSHKLGVAFASADRAITADGLAPATDATAGTTLLSPGSHIGFGCSPNAASLYSAHIRKLRYVPRRKSNAELSAETA